MRQFFRMLTLNYLIDKSYCSSSISLLPSVRGNSKLESWDSPPIVTGNTRTVWDLLRSYTGTPPPPPPTPPPTHPPPPPSTPSVFIVCCVVDVITSLSTGLGAILGSEATVGTTWPFLVFRGNLR